MEVVAAKSVEIVDEEVRTAVLEIGVDETMTSTELLGDEAWTTLEEELEEETATAVEDETALWLDAAEVVVCERGTPELAVAETLAVLVASAEEAEAVGVTQTTSVT